MPKIGEPIKKKPYVEPEGRWKCPVCRAIHHYNKANGCSNPKCSFRGKLERIR